MKLPDPERLLEKPYAESVFLLTACVTAMLYRGWDAIAALATGVPRISHVSYDGVYYVQIARNILSGDGLGWEAMIFPVLQPILVAALSFVTGVQNLAFLSGSVSQVAGICLLVPVYYIAREVYGRKAGAAAVLILIPYPHLVAIAGGDTAESLYTFFVYLSLFLGCRALGDESGRVRYLVLTGVSLSLCYLARPEGLFVLAVFMAIMAWRLWRAEGPAHAMKRLALLVACFMLLALPYVSFLTRSYGRVVFSPKLPYESMAMKSKSLGEPMPQREIDGLTENWRIAWQEKGGAGVVLGYFEAEPLKFVRVYFENLASEMPWKVRNSSHLDNYPIVYPVYLWLLALLAFALLFRPQETRWKALLVWAPFVNLFVYPVFTKGFWIYHAPYVPSLVVLAVGGVIFLSARLDAKARRAVPLLLAVVVLWGAYSVYVRYSSRPQNSSAVSFKTTISDESLKVGNWARDNLGTKVTYMMGWSRLVYYLGGRWVCMPCDDPGKVVEYGARNGADYIVEELIGDEVEAGSAFEGISRLVMAQKYESLDAPYVVVFWKIRDTQVSSAR